MNEVEFSKLVDAWIVHSAFGLNNDGQKTKCYEEYWWAAEMVMNWKYDDEPELLWRFIVEVHMRDAGEKVAGQLAAGPIEDLMSEFGESYIQRVEALAGKDARFKRTLCGTWQDMMSDEVWARFQQARTGAC